MKIEVTENEITHICLGLCELNTKYKMLANKYKEMGEPIDTSGIYEVQNLYDRLKKFSPTIQQFKDNDEPER